jgi:hypothetical protein
MRPSEQVLAKAIEHQRAGRLEAAVAKGRGGRVVLERPSRLAPLLSQMPLTFCGAVPLDRKPTPWWASWAPAEWPARGPAAGQGTRPTELALCGGGRLQVPAARRAASNSGSPAFRILAWAFSIG